MPACGNDASRSWMAARLAKSSASTSAIWTRRSPASVLAVSSNMSVIRSGAAAGPPPPGSSVGGDLDGDRDAVGDHVVDGRARLGPLDDLAQLVLGRVAAHPKRHPDALKPVARLGIDAQ